MRFADIAVNLADPMFQGEYHGRTKHPSDIEQVVSRARQAGVERILITGTSLGDSRKALELAKRFNLHCTAGIHPTSTAEIDEYPDGSDRYLKELYNLIEDDRSPSGSKRIISIGEIGLDYDRLHHAPKETQLRYLSDLLRLSQTFKLPMFLHSRNASAHHDLVVILRKAGWGAKGAGWYGGVVHSFTGTLEEMTELVEMGLYIGINGCSLKTAENLAVVKQIPLDRLLLETDSPWCAPTASHASYSYLSDPGFPSAILEKVSKPQSFKAGLGVKGRMEPAEVVLIAHVVASLKEISIEELAEQTWDNAIRLFWKQDGKLGLE